MKRLEFSKFVPAIIMMAAAIAFTSCSSGGGMKMGDEEYTVVPAARTTARLTTSHPAVIRGLRDVEIRPQVSGFITKLCVEEGATVRKGQPLFVIDKTRYAAAERQAAAAVEMARSAVNTAELSFKQKTMLHEKNIISDFEYSAAEDQLLSARAGLAQAEAALVSARQALGFCTVTSPADGVVGVFPYREGSLVGPQSREPLTTVSDIDKMYVYYSMTEKELLKYTRDGLSAAAIAEEMPDVELRLSDGTIYPEKGKVDAISGVINAGTGSVTVRAIFSNKDRMLRSGGTASVISPYIMENVVTIPQEATQEIQNKKFVFILAEGDTIHSRNIEIYPLDNGQEYIVTKGLESGEKYVIEGVQKLHNGMKITPITPAQRQEKFHRNLRQQNEGDIASAFK